MIISENPVLGEPVCADFAKMRKAVGPLEQIGNYSSTKDKYNFRDEQTKLEAEALAAKLRKMPVLTLEVLAWLFTEYHLK